MPERGKVTAVLARYLAEGAGTLNVRTAELVPGEAGGWLTLAQAVGDAESEIMAAVARRAWIDARLDELAWQLYRRGDLERPGGSGGGIGDPAQR